MAKEWRENSYKLAKTLSEKFKELPEDYYNEEQKSSIGKAIHKGIPLSDFNIFESPRVPATNMDEIVNGIEQLYDIGVREYFTNEDKDVVSSNALTPQQVKEYMFRVLVDDENRVADATLWNLEKN